MVLLGDLVDRGADSAGVIALARAWQSRRSVRILPHVIDTAFLVSGVALVLLLQLHVMQSPWLLAKLSALVAYVVFGSIALKRGRTMRIRKIALVLAVLTFAYIVGTAISKSPSSWLAL